MKLKLSAELRGAFLQALRREVSGECRIDQPERVAIVDQQFVAFIDIGKVIRLNDRKARAKLHPKDQVALDALLELCGGGAHEVWPTTNIDELAKDFELTDWETTESYNQDYIFESAKCAYEYYYRKDKPVDGDYFEDEKFLEAEADVQGDLYKKWHDAVFATVEYFYERHQLELQDLGNGSIAISPKTTWTDALVEILETVNGVGYFSFDSVEHMLMAGPYTPRQAVLEHLHWMRRYPEVYGDYSVKRRFEMNWRD